MMMTSKASRLIRPLILIVAVLFINGCVLDDEPASIAQIGGSVGDGPVVGATVTIYSNTGEVLGVLQSDGGASYNTKIKTRGNDYPLRLVADGGIDLVSGYAPDFEMVSVIMRRADKIANINPFSTLIVRAAESMPGGLTGDNLTAARDVVMSTMSFGLDSAVIPDPITTQISGSNVANIVKSSEAVGELVRRTRDLLVANGKPFDGDGVMEAFSADLVDGAIDGQGPAGADAGIAAIGRVVSGQVLIESLSNNLRVGGVVATGVLDQAIITTQGGQQGVSLTGSVHITRGMLDEALTSLAAARVLDNSAAVNDIAVTVAGLVPGSTSQDVASVLPASSTESLINVVNLVPAATQTEIDAVILATSTDPVVNDPVNTVPVISGSPAGSVTVNDSYIFQPTALDGDNDMLVFSVSNLPLWASFDTSSGVLSGVPGDNDAGQYANIEISVTDGTDTARLPVFSVQVNPLSVINTPPVIGGSPTGSVFTNNAYIFDPIATDVDGDSLTFSIVNKPSWASFNTSSGRLGGTPLDIAAGTYSGITISVSDGSEIVSLPGFSIQVIPAPVINTPPVIGGVPGAQVIANNGYIFQPSASDADGDALTFSIVNMPSWASFSTVNGTLSGAPATLDTGVYSNIVISVTDGEDTASLPGFSIQVDPSLGSLSLGWVAPTARSDGTPLPLSEIAGYRIYFGTSPGNYPDSVTIMDSSASSTVINNLPGGTYYLVMTTLDVNGIESEQSSGISKIAN